MSPATIIVGIVILIAVIYMVRHVRGMFNGSSGCSCCDGGGSCCSTRKSKSDSTKNKEKRVPLRESSFYIKSAPL